VGHVAGLDGCRKSRPHRDSITGPSSPYRVAVPTELEDVPVYLEITVPVVACCVGTAAVQLG
jgi:hypothetical protein